MTQCYSSKLAKDLAPMPHVMHNYLLEVCIHAVDDAVIANADAIQVFRASQLGRLTRKRIIF
jgi:hypothetical protein